jgi:hypothetical protein
MRCSSIVVVSTTECTLTLALRKDIAVSAAPRTPVQSYTHQLSRCTVEQLTLLVPSTAVVIVISEVC